MWAISHVCEKTYTFFGSSSSGGSPSATNSLSEPADKSEPGKGVGMGVNIRAVVSHSNELLSIFFGGLLATEPLVLFKLSFNCVDHRVKCGAEFSLYQN